MFSWSNKPSNNRSNANANANTNSNTSNNSSSKYTTTQHLSSYLTDPALKQSTRKVNDTTYDTVFQTIAGNALILRVHIPPSNAISAPKMTLVGIRAHHPWIDYKMKVTGYPPIQSDFTFVQSKMLLGKAVNEVVQHFQLHPPNQLEIIDQALRNIQASLSSPPATQDANIANAAAAANKNRQPSMAQIFGNKQESAQPPPAPPQKQYTLPHHFTHIVQITDADERKAKTIISQLPTTEKPNNFPQFDTMKLSELTQCLDNNDILEPILQPMPIIQQTKSIHQKLIHDNTTKAQSNIIHNEQTLDILLQEVIQLQSSLKEKVDKVNELQMVQMELCKPMQKSDILWNLRKAKKESMDESENMAHDWLNNDDGDGKAMDKFVDGFLITRTIHHVRAAKMEQIEQSM